MQEAAFAVRELKQIENPRQYSYRKALPGEMTDGDWEERSQPEASGARERIIKGFETLKGDLIADRAARQREELQQRDDAARKSAERLRRVAREMAARQPQQEDQP
jgi:hypothetical protein